MYTSKILTREEQSNGTTKVTVEFTDGVKKFTDFCIPQDRAGFDYWLKSKLDSLNFAEAAKTELVEGAVVEPPSNEPPEPPVLTQEEIDRNTWLGKYAQWVRIKTTLVDTGIVNISNPKAAAMLQNLKDTLRPEYIDFI